jgi:hypothetical protein
MSAVEIIDTFPAFLKWWDKAQFLPIEEQIENWEKKYLKLWPELLNKQIDNYDADGVDWHRIAHEKVFPYFKQRLPLMQEAHDNLCKLVEPLYDKAQTTLNFNSGIFIVIYVGIGIGAGWAAQYKNQPALLFGLENIAECDWSNHQAIQWLIAHELGHLVHYSWREAAQKTKSSGPWWQLYEEGFAQYIENLLAGDNNNGFHQGVEWLSWCQENKAHLASEFLTIVDKGESAIRFFGSWYKIFGKSETGYYLGYEAIKELEKQFSFKDIALLEDVAVYLRPIIKDMLY